MDEPLEPMVKIRQIRQYQRVFQACQAAKTDEQIPDGPMADLYYAIEDDIHLDGLRADIREARRKRAPKREIEKLTIRADKFEAAMNEKRRKNRARRARGGR